MLEIPEAKNTDAEDVVWGLQTAETLWKRGERIDALVWLRRAAQAAGDANDDDRALELARFAAEITEEIAREIEEEPLPEDPVSEPTLLPPVDETEHEAATSPPPEDPEPESRPSSFPPAAHVHAGMFDPWAEQAVPSSSPITSIAPEAEPTPAISIHPDEEIVTSVRPAALAAQRASDAPPSGSFRASSSQMPTAIPPLAPPPKVPKPPPPLPARAKPPLPVTAKPPAVEALEAEDLDADAEEESTTSIVAVDDLAVGNGLDLESVDAFADLPDDARLAFASAAALHTLGEHEEIGGFALAYVVDGAVDVAATMVDASAARLPKGSVLRARGTTDENVPIRLIGVASRGSNVVATWSDAAVEAAFRSIPWVEEDLRAAADRVQTLVGITIGPLGERLDQQIREEIFGRLTMKPLLAGDLVVRAGEPVPGLLLVGIGELELLDANDAVTGVVGSGEFLFATEVLGAGAAPSTVRAGSGGALIMFGDRGVAQELLVTCPPLLEVFAGM